ncbi:uncharacterized protein LOC111382792 [Olea europaea var. sylvestris]|uniref:uncharacterized protein LOC111382792 n=1 Tax=Olea europaea var. sylvestris TaxID=158386 RepID=UPI000C1D37D5|nr:uncharacterized protein LOC111382792 [Olea europaea var. sylvestris]XP_022862607.1 uncharacterized protein LOC111382792 [Olea europaea var. sylvestris]XP_022862608.1 uncharacterized protein LOC111382792 [Olea europaea var. sylvestris]XP_022862614.1 uncharacterized protein LOC111382792 [Olea europaea var. sylvestris]XP_022862619.1 uncharacterized protein LOC111382792 [Olea europaea var. sylvestris]XP_022862627.1 uncharacterized protein LOC111382792 [Olea europaea var. sylvestris]
MNPSKIEDDLFHHLGPPPTHREQFIDPRQAQSHPSIDDDAFSLDLFRDEDDDDVSHTSSDGELPISHPNDAAPPQNPNMASSQLESNGNKDNMAIDLRAVHVSPEPHVSSQFYTFNKKSHALMIQCLIEGRLATPEEIRAVTPTAVLTSWRSVWKDRNEDTAYLTAWKRIQDKLTVQVADTASASAAAGKNHFLCFKNNCNQFVSHVDQWQDIVISFHGDADLKHLGLKETVERIKQVWTVGAKFYGIPESYIRTYVASCPVCLDESSGCAPRSKRRRFEYTESFDVPAKEVPVKLQQLAAKHKVVLCIRQKYIRYKPFMAEVKDYACHRAGEPASKKSRILKREPYASKRCGCGFRIRAIVPISNYNEKDKTFVYEEEGTAVFKLYAVHSGHEPGPLDGNARIMHRMVGHKGGFLMDHDTVFGMSEEGENEDFRFLGKNSGDLQHLALQKVQELRNELGLLEGRIMTIQPSLLGSLTHELFDITNKLRNLADDGSKSVGLPSEKQHLDDVLVVEHDLPDWCDDHHSRIYGDGKDADVIEDDEDSFGRTLGEVASWGRMRTESRNEKDLLSETCKEEKWLKCGEFDEKGIPCDLKLIKPSRHEEAVDPDVGLAGIQVDGFYPENPKWFDSPCRLDPDADCGTSGFQHV